MKKVVIYTDGACKGNPGAGGWAAIIICDGVEKELCGGDPDTTNNRMELTSVIRALEELTEGCSIELHSDSKYVIDGITKWIKGWVKKNWMTSGNTPVKNRELWVKLLEASRRHEISWNWVEGHAGHEYNERADKLAKSKCPT
ncbi:MAG: ribonuclease HI [Holosporaceae bacterium]|jgi:ribonuclease HI|nr:ribonuclease HI [Holosporaceae bacterium]